MFLRIIELLKCNWFLEANKLENNIDPEWLEVDINKPIKVTKKVLIPSFRHPKVVVLCIIY